MQPGLLRRFQLRFEPHNLITSFKSVYAHDDKISFAVFGDVYRLILRMSEL